MSINVLYHDNPLPNDASNGLYDFYCTFVTLTTWYIIALFSSIPILLKIMARHIQTACNPAGTSPLKLREQLLSDKSPFNPRGGWGFVLIGALVPLNHSSLFWIWLIISTGYSFAIISQLNVIGIPLTLTLTLTLMLFMQARTFSYKFVSIGFYSRPEINYGVLSRKSHNYYINRMMFS